jgi:hypothetical protein
MRGVLVVLLLLPPAAAAGRGLAVLLSLPRQLAAAMLRCLIATSLSQQQV